MKTSCNDYKQMSFDSLLFLLVKQSETITDLKNRIDELESQITDLCDSLEYFENKD